MCSRGVVDGVAEIEHLRAALAVRDADLAAERVRRAALEKRRWQS